MPAGNRIVVGLFALAVAGALGAVAWLVLRTVPAAEPAPVARPAIPPEPVKPAGTRKPVLPPPRPDRPGRMDHPKPGPRPAAYQVAGEVRGPDDAPVAGAEVSVISASAKDALQPSPAASTGRVPLESLRELFAMDPEDAEKAILYSGVPALPDAGTKEKEVGRGTTGDDGKFAIPVAGRGPFRVEARKEGIGSAVAADAIANAPTPLVLRLGASSSLSGRVVNGPGGPPVEGAVVSLRSGGVAKGLTTGPDGAFTVPDLPPGRYVLTAGAPGYAPVTMPPVEAPSATPLEVVLGSGWTARILVVKRELPAPGAPPVPRGSGPAPGTPVEGALVVLLHQPTQTYRSGVTGSDGTVRIERLGAGQWQVGVQKEGFTVGTTRTLSFRIGSPPEESREVRLLPAVPTPILVLDESGAPLRNAKVYTGGKEEEYDERHSKLVGRTDEEGRIKFTFDDGIPWKSAVWVVPEEGGAVVRVEADDPTSGAEVKAVVHPGRVVQGTVTDAKGKAVKGAQVYAHVTDDEKDVDVGMYIYTDDKGAYRFPSLPWGDLSLEVDAEGAWDTQDVDADVKDNPLVRDFKVDAGE